MNNVKLENSPVFYGKLMSLLGFLWEPDVSIKSEIVCEKDHRQ